MALNNDKNPLVEVIAIRPVRWEVNGAIKVLQTGEAVTMKQSEANYQRTQQKFLPKADARVYFKERNIKPAIPLKD